MEYPSLSIWAADIILFSHVFFVLFMVVGLLLIYLGGVARWPWVRNPWFRILHLLGAAIVVVQAWVGALCPLTVWEMDLREQAGAETYSGSFIQHWLQALLYYSAPEWIFVVAYTLFACLALLSWVLVKPTGLSKD